MSSGRVWSLGFSLALPFFPFEPLPEAFRSFSAGDEKSILNASFLSRLGLEAAVASVASAAQQSEVSASD